MGAARRLEAGGCGAAVWRGARAMTEQPRIVLYRRAECAACDRAAAAVRSIAAARGLPWSERGVEENEALERRFGPRVPVVALKFGGEQLELAAERVDPAALARELGVALSRTRPD